jgi:hypothetical protein
VNTVMKLMVSLKRDNFLIAWATVRRYWSTWIYHAFFAKSARNERTIVMYVVTTVYNFHWNFWFVEFHLLFMDIIFHSHSPVYGVIVANAASSYYFCAITY